ncbi:MAG: glycosyltransferase family 39 protein [Lachnospiraceae bacterium]|nr:glycosyltransferase family 39 protein [Lachnospiraceae bacterium]
MDGNNKKIEKMASNIFRVLAFPVFFILFAYAFHRTGFNGSQYVYFMKDNYLKNILGILAVFFFSYIFCRLTDNIKSERVRDIIAVIVALSCTVFSFVWIASANVLPEADQSILIEEAVALSEGDYSNFGAGGYMSQNPHQMGYLTLLRVLFFFFGKGNYKAAQYFNAILVFFIVFSGYMFIKIFFSDKEYGNRTSMLWLPLIAIFFPMYGYVPYVYGEIPSIAFIMLSLWMLAEYTERGKKYGLVLFGIFAGLSYTVRINSIIIFAGVAIFLAVKLLSGDRRRMLCAIISLVAGVILFEVPVSLLHRAYNKDNADAMPMILWVAMGTNTTFADGPGWFDAYIYYTFWDADNDADKAKEKAYADIGAFIKKCADDPAFAFHFYSQKLNSQWNSPLLGALAVTKGTGEGRRDFARILYEEKQGRDLAKMLGIIELASFLAAIYIILVNRAGELKRYILLIGIYGGVLFTMLWEAHDRYVFQYMLLLMAVLAVAMGEITGIVEKYEKNLFKGVLRRH